MGEIEVCDDEETSSKDEKNLFEIEFKDYELHRCESIYCLAIFSLLK